MSKPKHFLDITELPLPELRAMLAAGVAMTTVSTCSGSADSEG